MSTAGTQPSESLVPHKFIWVGVIVGLLTLQVFMSAIAVFLATSDDSTAIEPNYGAKALQWDEAMAAKRASDSLGWKTVIDVPAIADLYGKRTIRLTVLDKSGAPVKDADVKLAIFHHAHASHIHNVSLAETKDFPGTYSAAVEMRRGGLWEFRITAKRGSEEFYLAEVRDVPSFQTSRNP